MQQRIIRILIASVLAISTLAGVRSIAHYHNKVEVQRLELKSSQLKAKTLELEYDKALKQLDNKNASDQQLKDAQDKLNQLEQDKQKLEQQLQAKANAKTGAVAYAAPAVSGDKYDWMNQAGIAQSDQVYVDYIVSHESGWRVDAYNPSGAYGLCQSLPGSKMASAGGDWQTNPVTQLRWCDSYAQGRGGWYASYLFWQAHSWW